MTGWQRTVFRRAAVLCAVVALHGAVITMFFASSVQMAVNSKKQDTMQMVFITAQVLAPAEPAQALPEVEPAPAAPEHPPAKLAKLAKVLPEVQPPAVPEPLPAEADQALPEVEPPAAPEQQPAEPAQAPSEPTLQEVAGQGEGPANGSVTSASASASASDYSRFSLHYHLAAQNGIAVRHGESTLTFNGGTDHYVADFGWTLGDENGLARSEGKLFATLSPSAYTDGNQLPKPMPALVQDPVSMVWMLRQILQQREAKPALENSQSGGDFSMLLGNEVIPYHWEILQTDELMLPGGTFDGILLQSHSEVPGAPIFAVWFTPSHPHVPLRIRRTDANGRVTDHLLKDNLAELVKAT